MEVVAPPAPAAPNTPAPEGDGENAPIGGDDRGAPDFTADSMGPPKVKPPSTAKRDAATGKFVKKGGGLTDDEGEAEREPAAKRRERIKYVADGKEVEEEIDFDELVASRRKSLTFDKRMSEAAKMRQEAEEKSARAEAREKSLREKGYKALLEAGMTKDEVLARIEADVEELLADEKLTPEQRELRQYKEKDKQAQHAARAAAQKKQEAAEEAEVQAELETQSNVINKALEQIDLPKDDLLLQVMAQKQFAARSKGYQIPPEELARDTFEQLIEHQDRIISSVKGPALLKKFPKLARAIAEELRRQYTERKSGGIAPSRQNGTSQRSEPERKIVLSDREMDEAYGLRPKRA